MPKVSIIIPTYNRSGFLRAAINSVKGQSFQDFELIVVDDASDDDTGEVVSALADMRIRYIRHDRNRGEAESRNTAISYATGEYIAFLDDDDEWLESKLELQVSKLDESPEHIGLVYSGHISSYYVNEKLVGQWEHRPVYRGNMLARLMKTNIIGAPSTVVIKRECVSTVGLFDPTISYGLDYDYWIRIAKHYDFDYVGELLVKYRIHKDSLSFNNELRAQGAEDLAHKYGKDIIASKYWQSIYLPLGIERCSNGQMKKGRNAIWRSIRYFPMNKSGYFYFGLALLGQKNFKKGIELKKRYVNHTS